MSLLLYRSAWYLFITFESKRKEYEIKVQNYNAERQSKLVKIDELIAVSRNDVLNALKPILEEFSNEKGITILPFDMKWLYKKKEEKLE